MVKLEPSSQIICQCSLPESETHSPALFSQLYRVRAKQMIDAAIAACPDVPLAPWIGFPGWRRPIPGARLGQGMADSCYEVTQADLIDTMTYGVQQGYENGCYGAMS